MSIDLEGTGGVISLEPSAWTALLDLAQLYGWQPHGTVQPPALYPQSGLELEGRDPADIGTDDSIAPVGMLSWDGSYIVGVGQQVTTEDAAALADALDRALELSVELTDEQRRRLMVVIAFCRAGGFSIG